MTSLMSEVRRQFVTKVRCPGNEFIVLDESAGGVRDVFRGKPSPLGFGDYASEEANGIITA
jgi:hypothetical protein